MKNVLLVSLALMLAFSSCKSIKDLVVKEEKVEVVNKSIVKQTYYVIIGSFSEKANADKYMTEIKGKQFSPVLLRNAEGLYRVSVYSTNSERAARQQISTIRQNHPVHKDVWLLISKK